MVRVLSWISFGLDIRILQLLRQTSVNPVHTTVKEFTEAAENDDRRHVNASNI